MLEKRNLKMKWIAASVLIGVLLGPHSAFAVATDSNAQRNDILNIEMPTTEEHSRSRFDFILDPQGLLYLTGAKRYDGGEVEEGATLLFRNQEGQYDFSSTSDRLTIANRGRKPVTVTVSVFVTGLNEISIREDEEFEEGERSFYLAVADNQGNEEPIHANGKATLSFDLDDPEKGGDFEGYSFGLTGSCNPDADWKGVSDSLVITIIWRVEPKTLEEEEPILEEGQGADSEIVVESDSAEELKPAQEKAEGSSPRTEGSNQEEVGEKSETTATASEKETTTETSKETEQMEESYQEETGAEMETGSVSEAEEAKTESGQTKGEEPETGQPTEPKQTLEENRISDLEEETLENGVLSIYRDIP